MKLEKENNEFKKFGRAQDIRGYSEEKVKFNYIESRRRAMQGSGVR